MYICCKYFKNLGFWASRQPNPQSGECVDVALTDDRQTWELTTCESLLPFMCRSAACPAGMYHRIVTILFFHTYVRKCNSTFRNSRRKCRTKYFALKFISNPIFFPFP